MGKRKRTWLQKLKYEKADWALMAFSVAMFVGCTVVRVAFPALGYVWVPQTHLLSASHLKNLEKAGKNWYNLSNT